jgi:Pyridoxamine 5'-phosphate oxidase
MADDECDAFLASHKWARVATVSPDGEPTVSAVGYVALDGALWFYGMARGRRAADIEAGSRVSMCIDDGVEEGQGYAERSGAASSSMAPRASWSAAIRFSTGCGPPPRKRCSAIPASISTGGRMSGSRSRPIAGRHGTSVGSRRDAIASLDLRFAVS